MHIRIPSSTTPRGNRHFPILAALQPARCCPPNLTNSAMIDSILKDGKMYLSLNDAVSLSLENNLDIAIQRYNLDTADTDILRTASGAIALGVNAGVVQGTPGGTTGSVATAGARELQPPVRQAEALEAVPSPWAAQAPVLPASWPRRLARVR